MKCTNASLQSLAGSSVGGGSCGIRKSTRKGGETLWCGGLNCASSIAVMPSDQMSVLKSYEPSTIISGDIHIGEPMTVERLASVPEICAATPKSASFTLPASVSRMFPALTSRWMRRHTLCR